jgi:hypothetical protein
MNAVSSASSNLSSLIQKLSSLESPVLSSPAVVAALQKAPPADVVQLSIAASQLESVGAMFGDTSGSTDGKSGSDLSGILSAFGSTAACNTSTASSTTDPVTAALGLRAQGQLGYAASGGLAGSLFDVLG